MSRSMAEDGTQAQQTEQEQHDHCATCVKYKCAVKLEPPEGCSMVNCHQHCGARYHACKQPEHARLCPASRVPCINRENGCPLVLPREQLGRHLATCPASVMHCTMEWNRWPVYSKERQTRVPFVQDNIHARYGQLDVALALRDQRMLNRAMKAPRSTRRALRNSLTQRFPAVPLTPHHQGASGASTGQSNDTSQTVSDDDSDAPWEQAKEPPGLQRSVCSELFRATKHATETLSNALSIATGETMEAEPLQSQGVASGQEANVLDKNDEVGSSDPKDDKIYVQMSGEPQLDPMEVSSGENSQDTLQDSLTYKKLMAISDKSDTQDSTTECSMESKEMNTEGSVSDTRMQAVQGVTQDESHTETTHTKQGVEPDTNVQSQPERETSAQPDICDNTHTSDNLQDTSDPADNNATPDSATDKANCEPSIPSGPIPDPPFPMPITLKEILALDLTLESITRYQVKPKSMYTFLCAQDFRRDEYPWHFKNVHNDIHSGLNGWLEQRCPLATYGCTFSLSRLHPHEKGYQVIYSDVLESFGVKRTVFKHQARSGIKDTKMVNNHIERSQHSKETHLSDGETIRNQFSNTVIPRDTKSQSPMSFKSKESTPEIFTSRDYNSAIQVNGNLSKLIPTSDNRVPPSNTNDNQNQEKNGNYINPDTEEIQTQSTNNQYPANQEVSNNKDGASEDNATYRNIVLTQLPFEVLQNVALYLDSYSMCNLALTCRLLRDVCCTLLEEKGIVVQQWERSMVGEKTHWYIAYKRWQFSTAFDPVHRWGFEDQIHMSEHLKVCPFFHTQPKTDPLLLVGLPHNIPPTDEADRKPVWETVRKMYPEAVEPESWEVRAEKFRQEKEEREEREAAERAQQEIPWKDIMERFPGLACYNRFTKDWQN